MPGEQAQTQIYWDKELTTVPRDRRDDDRDGPSYSVSMLVLARLMVADGAERFGAAGATAEGACS